MPQAHEIDTRYAPKDIVHPLPADSSQLAAVMAASEGHDTVIIGPPGTGKSQTIANPITQCLAVGKTVLFVAEKTAALDVVHRRLKEHGLGDCCVELYSNKAEKRRFLDQLEASWKNRAKENAADWISVSERLRIRRDQLNAYASALHTPESNGWTAYRAMGEFIRGREMKAPLLRWPPAAQHTRDQYADIEATIDQLATTHEALSGQDAELRIEATEWSMVWETSLLECCQQLSGACEALAAAQKAFGTILGLSSLTDVSSTQLTKLYRFAHELAWVKVRKRAEQLGLASFVEVLCSGAVPASEAMARFHLAYARWWLPSIVDRRDPLRNFQRFMHETTLEAFRQLDDQARKAAAPLARLGVLHGLPPSDQVPRKSELGLLRHQISLKRPSKSIREMIAGMPDSFGKLAPCLMMSPLSIAQYLPAGHSQFGDARSTWHIGAVPTAAHHRVSVSAPERGAIGLKGSRRPLPSRRE